MKPENIVRFLSEDKKVSLYCDADTALGALHDFLMLVKGDVVGRIQEAQKQELEASKKVKDVEEKQAAVKEVEGEKPKEEVPVVPIEEEKIVPIETK